MPGQRQIINILNEVVNIMFTSKKQITKVKTPKFLYSLNIISFERKLHLH